MITIKQERAQLEASTKASTRAAENLTTWEHKFLDAEDHTNKEAIRVWDNAPEHVKKQVWALYTPK